MKLVARTSAPAEKARQECSEKEAEKWWGHVGHVMGAHARAQDNMVLYVCRSIFRTRARSASLARARARTHTHTHTHTRSLSPTKHGGVQQQGKGKGKGGNFWMLGHRSLSYAATALAHTCCDSDDSLDIVLR